MNPINERITGLIKNNKCFSQKELAANIGVSASTLNNWLKLMRDIPADKVIPICEYFSVSVDYLLTGTDASPPRLDASRQELIAAYDALDTAKQAQLLGFAQGLAAADATPARATRVTRRDAEELPPTGTEGN